MHSFSELLDRVRQGETVELPVFEAAISAEIARASGSRRGAVDEESGFCVQRVPLGVEGAAEGLQSAVRWLSRRVRESGHGIFNLTLRRQPGSLVLVVEWNRGAPAIERRSAAKSSSHHRERGAAPVVPNHPASLLLAAQ